MKQDVGTLVWLIERGADPDAPARVRAPLLGPVDFMVTPVEAVVRADQVEMLDLLLRHGASLDAASRVRLACLARERGTMAVAAYLESAGAPIPDRTCRDAAQR